MGMRCFFQTPSPQSLSRLPFVFPSIVKMLLLLEDWSSTTRPMWEKSKTTKSPARALSDSGKILSFRCLAHFPQPNALASRHRHFSASEKLARFSMDLTDSSSSHSLMIQQVKAAHQGQAPGANQVAPWYSTIRVPVLLAASSRVPTSATAISINFRIASFLRTS